MSLNNSVVWSIKTEALKKLDGKAMKTNCKSAAVQQWLWILCDQADHN